MYLPAEAQDKLFSQIGELSPAGSRVSAEHAPTHSDERREQLGSGLRRWPRRSASSKVSTSAS